MERYPVIITVGAALIGMVAGEMLVTDHALKDWQVGVGITFGDDGKPRVGGLSLELIAGAIGAIFVVAYGKWASGRKQAHAGEAAAKD
jgi:predicted tellurium resistance membrane protein TerC